VVAAAVGGVADVLEEGRWGRLISARTPAAIAAGLREALAGHRGRSSDAVAAGQRYAREKYSVERLVLDHVALYESLLERAGLNDASF
jgi:glycosyltransferase involved in cell wall biosynthesis